MSSTVPARVLGLAAKILSNYYSHAEIDNRFRMCGYETPAPGGNKLQKLTDWLIAANNSEIDPVDKFQELIQEFMESDRAYFSWPIDGQQARISTFQEKLADAIEKSGMQLSFSAMQPKKDPFAIVDLIERMSENSRNSGKQGAVALGHKVFIVHGHRDSLTHQVARLVEKLGFEGIILSELPDRGRTVLQKFEDSSDVSYAIVLMTADDVGGKAEQNGEPKLKPRTRQNVLLELGYFVGKLGRPKVTILLEDGVEQPSDILGLLYTPVDQSAGWKLKLAQEMKASGLPVDMNKL